MIGENGLNSLTKKHKTIEKIYIYIWIIYSSAYVLFSLSNLEKYTFAHNLYLVIAFGTVITLFFLFFLVRRYTRKKLLFYILLLCLAFTIVTYSQSVNFLIGMLLALLAPYIDVKKLIVIDIKLKTELLFVVISLCGLGIIENVEGFAGKVYKQSLGFGNPNTLTMIAVSILMEWLFIHCGKVKKYQYLIIFLIMYIVSNISKGRTSLYTLIFIILLFLLMDLDSQLFYTHILKLIFAIITPILAVLCFVVCNLYRSGNVIVAAIDQFMTNRIYYTTQALIRYGVKFIGTQTENESLGVDIGYVYCALKYGLIYLVFICIIYSVQFIRFLKHKQIDVVLLMLFYIVASFGESHMLSNPIFNVSLLYLLYSNEHIESIDGQLD